MKSLSLIIGMLGLTAMGFEYGSGWCFVGAVIIFISLPEGA